MQKDLVIIRTDGGASSQVDFCALGKYFEDKGYKVKYDMTWFKECGVNIPGGKYIIDKAFPNLKIEFATDKEIKIYKDKYYRQNQPLDECKPPIYIDGYPEERPFLSVKYKDFFSKEFVFDTDDIRQRSILQEIMKCNSCGVHIRRGDLAKFNPAYGYPADKEYFLRVIDIVNKTNDNVCFYFFSNGMDWVKEHIIPHIKTTNYKIIEQNDDDKGYLDMYLLSRCKIIISSNSGFALMARLLSSSKDTQLWMCKHWDFICEALELDNVYIYIRPHTIVDRKMIFHSDFVSKFEPINSSGSLNLSNKKILKKYKKYKRLFNVFLIISIIYTVIFVFFKFFE